MSFKVEGKTQLVVDREIIIKVAERYGWRVEENTTIRSHDIATGHEFDVVLRNPLNENRSYDVGVDFSEDGKSAEFIYDKWGGAVESVFGDNCGKFKNECAVAKIQEEDTDVPEMSYEEYFDMFCSYDESGDLIYDGYTS